MSLNIGIISIISVMITTVITLSMPKIDNDLVYYKELFFKNKIIYSYFLTLQRVLELIRFHFGEPFSKQTWQLTTNLAVFYSFGVFFILYAFTGSGNLGNLNVLNDSISYPVRVFIFVTCIIYFVFLYNSYKSIHKYKHNRIWFNYLMIILSLLPSLIISLLVTFEWHSIKVFDNNIKTLAILMLATTLSAAILAFSGHGEGSKRGFGSLVFNITFLSLVGTSFVISVFLQYYRFGNYSILSLLILLFLISVTYFLWKWKYNLYYYNIFLVLLTVAVKYWDSNIIGVDIISVSLLYFFVVLPFFNGAMDAVSLSISRLFAQSILEKKKKSIIFTHIMFDIFISFSLLFVLITSFFFITQLFNYLMPRGSAYIIETDIMFKSLIRTPLSTDSIWLYVMFMSTLIPTFMHLFTTVSSLIFYYPYNTLRRIILKTIDKGSLTSQDKIWLLLLIVIARFGSVFAIVVSIVFIIRFVGPLLISWINEILKTILIS